MARNSIPLDELLDGQAVVADAPSRSKKGRSHSRPTDLTRALKTAHLDDVLDDETALARNSVAGSRPPPRARRGPRGSRPGAEVAAGGISHNNNGNNMGNRAGANNNKSPDNESDPDHSADDVRPTSNGEHNAAEDSKRARKARKNAARAAAAAKSEPLPPLTNAEHINVECRFVVRDSSHLTASRLSVNKPISPKQVWRVIAPPQDCPICLEKAEVPRMLACGHVMCLPCMIKHRRYSEFPDYCPICGEVVVPQLNRTTAVTFLEADPGFLPHEGQDAVLTLMYRASNSAVALPVNIDSGCSPSDPSRSGRKNDKLPGPGMTLWTRVCQGSLNYAKQELAAEVKQLIGACRRSVEEFGDDEGYEEAIRELKRHIQSLTDDVAGSPHGRKPHNELLADDGVFYYQSGFESPTVYTLSDLDMSILKSAFGPFTEFPTTLIARVENIETGVVNQRSDKRHRFLSHIPDQTPVAFLECDWTGVVPDAVLAKFAGKLAERRRRKVSKEVKEEAERQQALEAIDHQFKTEIAEAMLPHDGIGVNPIVSLDTSLLPSLPSRRPQSATSPAPPVERKEWVKPNNAYEELMKKAYVPKRGRKDIILQF